MKHKFEIILDDTDKWYYEQKGELEMDYYAVEVPYVEPKPEKHLRCIRCGKKLKDSLAQERGYGEICWKKHISDKQIPLF